MFSLLAFYFQYRNAQNGHAQTVAATDAPATRFANDEPSSRAVAKAA